MKKRSPTIAKVTRPIPSRVYPRKRLFDLLDRKRKHPVIWVSGPPGCGKTTLVTSYLDSKSSPCLWYQADEGDADPATFFYYLKLAAKKATPRKRKPLPLLTPEYLPGLPTFTLRYFENLFHRLKAPSFLVFDNYQEVPVQSPFQEVIRHGLSNIPEGINVILISRSEPPPVLIHMQANNLMEMIGWRDLRLTLKESNDIVKLQARQEVSPEAIEYIHTFTDGWLAGLMLMLKTSEIEKIDPRELGNVPTERIFDYFTGEIFDKTDEKSQIFLLKTAFLPKMTASMAEALTGFESANRILSLLNRNHCFTERRFRSSPAYEYHPLFRDFLLSRAKETFSPEMLSDLRRRAAMLLEEADQTEAAIALLHDASDWEGMVQLILKHAPAMMEQGRNRSLGNWLSSLPEDIVESIPWLQYWLGICWVPVQPMDARKALEKAFNGFRAKKDVAGVYLSWSYIIETFIIHRTDLESIDKWIKIFEDLVNEWPAFPSVEIEARVVNGIISALMYRQPYHKSLTKWVLRGENIFKSSSNPDIKLIMTGMLLPYCSWIGNLPLFKYILHACRSLLRPSDFFTFTSLKLHLAEAHLGWLTAEWEICDSAIDKAIKIAERSGIHIMDFEILSAKVYRSASSSDDKKMESSYRIVEQLINHSSVFDQTHIHYQAGWVSFLKGNIDLSYHHIEEALKLSYQLGSPFPIVVNSLAMAQIYLERKEYEEAGVILAKALKSGESMGSNVLLFHGLCLKAFFAFEKERHAEGVSALTRAMELGNKAGMVNYPWWMSNIMVRLCMKALEHDIEPDYVHFLIRKRDLFPQDEPLHISNWPWAIQVFTLGRFELVINGKPFKFPMKAQKKPLEMLKVLASFGEGQEVNKVQLSDILWPDADGDKALRSFDTTLHRLRQLLSHDKAIILCEGRLSLDLRYCWVDSMVFERILKQAEDYIEKADRKNAIQFLEKAVALFKDPFLAGEEEKPWAISYNERLRSKFLRCIENLGNYLEEEGELNKAVDCFQKAIEVEDVAEVFYQRLMNCLKQLGRRTDALSVYQRCEKTLSASLGLEPSPETKAIKESLFEE
ncbi:MAG: BTAD domain-containing putative transcriptional regulator [Ignavibacteriaceae bacterium]|jgi:LuxR family transcriptional regulator, maltose regulon positive regulatory protein|nr:BTAD domain-containing putative transcriptional regulator [Ignavibacteriaceae bacterium]